jgi:hypothetical protein
VKIAFLNNFARLNIPGEQGMRQKASFKLQNNKEGLIFEYSANTKTAISTAQIDWHFLRLTKA